MLNSKTTFPLVSEYLVGLVGLQKPVGVSCFLSLLLFKHDFKVYPQSRNKARVCVKLWTQWDVAGEVWVLILTCCNLHLPHSLDCVFQVRDHQERNVWAVWKADVTWCEMRSDGPGLVEAPACRCQLSQGSKRTCGSSGSRESWARCMTSNVVGKGTPSRARNWALV